MAGSLPGDPTSTPLNVGVPSHGTRGDALQFVGPNPFRAATEVHFSLAQRGRVDVVVYDLLGREMRAVAKGLWLEAGPQSLRWDGLQRDGRSAAAGVYFVRLSTPGGTWTRAVVRIR